MRFVVPAVLLIVALIHALPLVGVMGAAKLTQLYGVDVQDPTLEILLRHRAVLFGLLAAFLAYAAIPSGTAPACPDRRLHQRRFVPGPGSAGECL